MSLNIGPDAARSAAEGKICGCLNAKCHLSSLSLPAVQEISSFYYFFPPFLAAYYY